MFPCAWHRGHPLRISVVNSWLCTGAIFLFFLLREDLVPELTLCSFILLLSSRTEPVDEMPRIVHSLTRSSFFIFDRDKVLFFGERSFTMYCTIRLIKSSHVLSKIDIYNYIVFNLSTPETRFLLGGVFYLS